MKTRTAIIYLAVFLLLAGYFYYFEVVRREARLKEDEAALKLFHFDKDLVTALKLAKANTKLISLRKNDSWRIVEPLTTRADESTVGGLLSALQSFKWQREVTAEAEDLEPYGLDNPRIHLSFLAAGSWHHLRIGSKAMVGDNFYASGNQENRVVLISGAKQRVLDKDLFDLRSKDLFTLKSEEIDRIEIERSGHSLTLSRVEAERWQASTVPNLKIKTSKLEGLVNRLVWLRALRFLDQEQTDVARLGLDPVRIRISLSAQEEKETLVLGNTEKNEGVYAMSEELPGVALVDENLLKELPSNFADLEDRTFLALKLNQIRVLSMELDGQTGRLKRDGEKWKWFGNRDRKDPENWLVNSLLWKIQDLEYLPESPSQSQSPPENRQLNIVLFSENDDEIGTFILAEIPAEEAERGIMWFFKGGETARPYLTKVESLRDLHESVKKLMTSGASNPSPK